MDIEFSLEALLMILMGAILVLIFIKGVKMPKTYESDRTVRDYLIKKKADYKDLEKELEEDDDLL